MNVPRFPLEGKVAIVTGGKRGIGKGIALSLAEAGADVAICSRVTEDGKLEAVAEEIQQFGRRSLAIRADTSQKADVENMVQRVIDGLGYIDILVNNAGVISWGQPLLEASESDWNRIIDVNLKGYFLCAQAVGKKMIDRKKGSIINVASSAGIIPLPGAGVYSISKAGVVTLTRVLALELASYNIRVNAISPSWVKTDMNIAFRPDAGAEKQIASKVPLGRLGEPEDIGRVALYLASDGSDYITGQTIVVDGGMNDLVSSRWASGEIMR